jgi:hypothetical protein
VNVMKSGWHARLEIVEITTFQENNVLLLSSVLEGKQCEVLRGNMPCHKFCI